MLQTVKIIAVISDRVRAIASQPKEASFDAFLSKPITETEFIRVLQTTFADKGRRGEVVDPHFSSEVVEKIKILVVEDNEVNQMLLKEYLEELGCEADTACNGKEAIEKLSRQEYQIIFMDLQMPVMGGIEATKEIRIANPNIPIIAFTASVMKEDQEECSAAGMNDFLTKPFNAKDLKTIIRKCVGYPND